MDDDFVKYLKFHCDQRFGLPIPDSVIEEMSAKKYAKKSYRNVKWVLAMYRAWKWERNRMPNLDKIYIDLEILKHSRLRVLYIPCLISFVKHVSVMGLSFLPKH